MNASLSRLRQFWARHRNLFWMLHSAWALTTGAAIAYFAHERYHLVGWVALALALTWASTLYFGRTAAEVRAQKAARASATGATLTTGATPATGSTPSLVHEVTSYVTRVMYQETLFFLLPFYAYSTVVRSPNVTFLIILGALAAFSCIDIPFDRWLRTKPAFGFAFFSIVAFAALNLLLPLTFGLRVRYATPVSALIAIAVAIPLALRSASSGHIARLKLASAAVALLVITVGFPVLIPPVPLRLLSATFSSGINRGTLVLTDTLPAEISAKSVGSVIVVLVHIFAPTDLRARVRLVWKRDGVVLRTSREMEVVAHTTGFRAWDSWRSTTGEVPAGNYEILLETSTGRVIGEAALKLLPPPP